MAISLSVSAADKSVPIDLKSCGQAAENADYCYIEELSNEGTIRYGIEITVLDITLKIFSDEVFPGIDPKALRDGIQEVIPSVQVSQ